MTEDENFPSGGAPTGERCNGGIGRGTPLSRGGSSFSTREAAAELGESSGPLSRLSEWRKREKGGGLL